MSQPEASVVVTGTAWMGSGIGSIESALERLFREASHEIILTAYSISGGADLLLDWLEAALARGVQIKMIVNRLNEQPADVVARLRGLVQTYRYFALYAFLATEEVDLHAKVVVVDRAYALIGSSNLSRRGLLTNHEIAVLIQGAPAVTVAQAVDRLLTSRYTVRVSV